MDYLSNTGKEHTTLRWLNVCPTFSLDKIHHRIYTLIKSWWVSRSKCPFLHFHKLIIAYWGRNTMYFCGGGNKWLKTYWWLISCCKSVCLCSNGTFYWSHHIGILYKKDNWGFSSSLLNTKQSLLVYCSKFGL